MYLEIDEGFPGHRKTLRLCAALKNPVAAWYVIRLWTWACRSCPIGDLSGMDPYDIEIAVQYRPLDGACYAAMVAAGFIDEAAARPVRISDFAEGGLVSIRRSRGESNTPTAPRLYRGGAWETDRRSILERDRFVCRCCGSAGSLEVHHIIPLRCFNGDLFRANAPENLIALCRPCHVRADVDFRRSEASETT